MIPHLKTLERIYAGSYLTCRVIQVFQRKEEILCAMKTGFPVDRLLIDSPFHQSVPIEKR